MYRTHVLLEEKQYEFLKKLSEKKGKSISQVLREIIDNYTKKSDIYSLSSLAGILEDAESDGRDHDKWIYGRK